MVAYYFYKKYINLCSVRRKWPNIIASTIFDMPYLYSMYAFTSFKHLIPMHNAQYEN